MRFLFRLGLLACLVCSSLWVQAAPPAKAAPRDEKITVNVFGAVKKPGAVKLVYPCSVLDALGASGGYTTKADISQVVILRGPAGEKPEKIVVDVAAILRGEAPTFVLKNKDTITVSERHL